MNRAHLMIRLGWYSGLIHRQLGTDAYTRYGQKCVDEISDEEAYTAIAEIHDKLIAAGVIQPDEDPFPL